MVVIALLLLVVVVAVVVFVVVTGATGTITLEWDQLNLFFEPSPLVLFLLGAGTLLLLVVAIAMLRSGSRRSMAKRRELKRLRKLEGEQGTAPGAAGGPATRADAHHDTRHDTRHGAGHGAGPVATGDGRHADPAPTAPAPTAAPTRPGDQPKSL